MQAGRADLTMRYNFNLRFGSFLPQQATDAIRQQLSSGITDGTTTQIKGDRVLTSMGQMYSVANYAKGEITLVDPKDEAVCDRTAGRIPRHDSCRPQSCRRCRPPRSGSSTT